MHFLKEILSIFILCLSVLPAMAQENPYNLEETHPIEEGGTIHLTSDDAEVTITGTDRADVEVVVYRKVDVDGWSVKSSGAFKVDVENRGGDLYIKEENTEEHRVVFGGVQEEYRISIEAPKNVALNIKGDDDDYKIAHIRRNIMLEADDADVNLQDIEAQEFDFTIDDGHIRMDKGQGSLRLFMDDGDFEVQRSAFDRIDAKADDGQIAISTRLADEGRYHFDMDDGSLELNIAGGGGNFTIDHDDLNIDLGDQFEEKRVSEDRSQYRLAGGSAEVAITTDDGEIKLSVL